MKILITLIGLFGIFAVVVLSAFFSITAAVSKPGLVEFILMGANSLPFFFYVLFTLRNWSKKLGLQLGVPLHLVWMPTIFMFAQEGNFEIPLFLIAAFVVYLYYVRSLSAERITMSPPLD